MLYVFREKYQGVFGWAGEINVFKHALAGNGFFSRGNRVDIEHIEKGDLDPFPETSVGGSDSYNRNEL